MARRKPKCGGWLVRHEYSVQCSGRVRWYVNEEPEYFDNRRDARRRIMFRRAMPGTRNVRLVRLVEAE